jgi:hypothetical protein
LVLAAVACIALLGVALIGSGVAAAKKKKSKVAVVTVSPNAAIPDQAADTPTTNPPYGQLAVPLVIGKKFKGKSVGDVQLTLQTTGLAADSASSLFFRLTAPNGLTQVVDSNGFSGQSIGPLTLTANSPVRTCNTFGGPPPPPPCADPDATLNPPYQGIAGDSNLAYFRGLKMRGTWTLTAYDGINLDTSVLNLVSLRITPQKAGK